MKRFSPGVSEQLGHYVYRLIDPRDGLTFYVGRGTGDRVFAHVRGVLPDKGEDEGTLKNELIREIILEGLKPLHIIHRHHMNRETALHVEAALIDAFFNLTNKVKGHGSNRYGPATADQLNGRYSPDPIPTDQPIVVIKITRQRLKTNDNNIYKTVRASWIMSERRLEEINAVAHNVLAISDQRCIEVYSVLPGGWKKSPPPPEGKKQRYEFDGREADEETRRLYKGKVFEGKEQWPLRCFGF